MANIATTQSFIDDIDIHHTFEVEKLEQRLETLGTIEWGGTGPVEYPEGPTCTATIVCEF